MLRLYARALFACCAALWIWLAVTGTAAGAEPEKPSGKTAVEDLGHGQYRIGAIRIDKAKGRFSVPGTVIKLQQPDSPLEFIAVTKGGYKQYEAVFEMDTTAVDFNLACILIGLDASHGVQPKQHFDPQALKGDKVEIFVSWAGKKKTRRVPITDVLRVANNAHPDDEWIYTGSFFSPDGRYMADESGTLVGFVHDPESIIQHRFGLGLGDYGAVIKNPDVVPPPGTPIMLEISRLAK